eukprot:CAMPEP_0177623850 /NCGR_PEP_ID=MMETSP0419_2-20121207/29141_1 /TAXON_ID=582737 /ORGANISM="Tetraselmis sp., Strain GSL018" /LENGTH=1756 /DNA_ID=CAMNT_0019124467 /DNA_START=418 /DNA_END=5689 /DNA_ORIENTATION=+
MFGADWAVKRFLKFLLKRNIGRLLKNEVDVRKLEVQLGSGLVQMSDVLLNCEFLNENLELPGWELTRGYLGSLRATVPYAALATESCCLEADECLLVVRPAAEGGPAVPPRRGPPAAGAPAVDVAELAAEALSTGAQLLAGSIEHILQLLEVRVTNLKVRVELGRQAGAPALVLSVGAARYHSPEGARDASWQAEPPAETARAVSVEDVWLGLSATAEGGGAEQEETLVTDSFGGGASAAAVVRAAAGRSSSSLEVEASVSTLEAHLWPWQVPALREAARLASRPLPPAPEPEPTREAAAAAPEAEQELSSSEVLDRLIAPGYKDLLAEAILWGWGADESEDGGGEEEEAEGAELLPPGADLGAESASELADVLVRRQEAAGAGSSAPPRVSVALRVDGLAVALNCGERRGQAPSACASLPPGGQLVAEVGLIAALFSQEGPQHCDLEVSMWGLEAGERLPLCHPDAAGPTGALEAFARGPALLPAGLYTPGGSGSQSPWGRSTVYASCLAMSNSAPLGRSGMAVSGMAPQPAGECFEVWPVLVCGWLGERGPEPPGEAREPSARISLRVALCGAGDDAGLSAAELELQPLACWVRLPLLRRVEPFLQGDGEGGTAVPTRGADAEGSHGSLQRERSRAVGLRFSVSCEQLCCIGMVQPPPSPEGEPSEPVLAVAEACAAHGGPLFSGSIGRDDACGGDGAGLGCEAQAELGALSAYMLQLRHGSWGGGAAGDPHVDVMRVFDAVRDENHPEACTCEVSWRPSRQTGRWLLEEAWGRASALAGSMHEGGGGPQALDQGAVEMIHLQDRCILASALLVSVRAPLAELRFTEAEWGALSSAAALLAAEQAAACPGPSRPQVGLPQVSVLVQCRLKATVEPASPEPGAIGPEESAAESSPPVGGARSGPKAFRAAAGDLRVLWVGNLGGLQFAQTVSAQAADVSLDAAGASPASLLWCPQPGPGCYGLSVLSVTKPSDAAATSPASSSAIGGGADSALLGEPAAQPPSLQAVTAVDAADVTLQCLDGDPTLAWAAILGRCLSPGEPAAPPPATAAPVMGSFQVAVNIAEAALGCEAPPGSPSDAAAAVLTCGSLHWSLFSGTSTQEVLLTRVALYVAEQSAVSERHPSRQREPRSLPKANLLSEGHMLVAQEASLSLSIAAPGAGAGGGSETAISNQRLCITTCPRRLAALSSLASRLGDDEGIGAAQGHSMHWGSASAGLTPHAAGQGRGEPSGGAGVLGAVVEDMFREGRGPVPQDPLAASTVMAGGWYGQGNGPSASTMFEGPCLPSPGVWPQPWAGSAPAIRPDYLDASSLGFECVDEAHYRPESQGRWFGGRAAPAELDEDYVQRPAAAASGLPVGRGGAVQETLPAGHAPSQSRFLLRNISGVWRFKLADDPSAPGVDVEFRDAMLVRDAFPDGSEEASRLAVSVADVAVVDSAIPRADGNPWRTVLAAAQSPEHPRDSRRCFLSVELMAVRPDPAGLPDVTEARLSLAVVPLRLRLDQNVVSFLQRFAEQLKVASMEPIDAEPFIVDGAFDEAVSLGGDEGAEPYFQRVKLEGFTVLIDYRPRRVDVAALREGSLVEVANAVPWSGVELTFVPLHLKGCQGWDGLRSEAADAWLADIAANQFHKFLAGVTPLQSVLRVGGAALQVLSLPAGRLAREGRLYRTVHRGLCRLVETLCREAYAVGATVAGSAQEALGSGRRPPEGLGDAGRRLDSSLLGPLRQSGLLQSASQAASAVGSKIRSSIGGAGHRTGGRQ